MKFEDIETVKRSVLAHGRGESLIVFDENECFNFLHYGIVRDGPDGIGALVEILMSIIESMRRTAGGGGGNNGGDFWEDSTRMQLRHCLPPIYAATGTLTVDDIIQFIATSPSSREEMKSPEWIQHSFMCSIMERATNRPIVPMTQESMAACNQFWGKENFRTPVKTLGNVIASVSSALDPFRHGRLKKAFTGKTTIVPEMCYHGAIILLAMPTLTWSSDGANAQKIFKRFFQQAVLRRNSLAEKHQRRPLLLFCDEAQETVDKEDGAFLSTSRSANCCTIYMTQTLSNYFSKMGGNTPREDAEALVNKFGTHVYFSNSCPVTNEYAARTIGKVWKRHANYSEGTSQNRSLSFSRGYNESTGTSASSGTSESSGSGGPSEGTSHSRSVNASFGTSWGLNQGTTNGTSESRGYSESLEYLIEPGDFGRNLQTGGPPDFEVTGYWYQNARRFSNGHNVMLARFNQR